MATASTFGRDVKYAANHYLDEHYSLVLAIDFGTAFSGYAFSFNTENGKDDVKVNRNWGQNLGMESFKTPTCILFDGNEQFVAFGYNAQKEYAELEDGLDQEYFMFDFFKMNLHQETKTSKTITTKTELTAGNGKKMKAIKVFAEALRYLKNHFLESLRETNIQQASEDLIRWVITVPAIWSYRAKGFMREAALEANLIDKRNSKKLIIALEPESGSLYCRNLDINQFADVSRMADMGKLTNGTTYVVLDAGGGTLDVSIHKVIDENKAEEIHYATGGAHGGSYVDQNFRDLLGHILTEEFMKYFTKRYPSQWLAMKIDFEQKKRACRADNTNTTKLQLLYQLGTAYQEYTKKPIESAFKDAKGKGVRISNGMIVLKHNVMEVLFNGVIIDNVVHVENLLDEMKEMAEETGNKFVKPTYIFMVGGFSDSHMLQKSVIKKFGKGSQWGMQVMVPQEASLAVVKGAVRFGHDPSLITERKAAFCYGIKVRNDYKRGTHDEKKVKGKPGNEYVHIFDVKVRRNDPLKSTGVGIYHPTNSEQQAVNIELYYSEEGNSDRCIDDDGVFYLGLVKAPWQGKGLERTIEITLELGGTELRVSAITQPGNVKTEAQVDLFHEQNI